MNLLVSAKGKISQQARPRELAWVDANNIIESVTFRIDFRSEYEAVLRDNIIV